MHWAAVKWIFRYLKGAADQGIVYTSSPLTHTTYADADLKKIEVSFLLSPMLGFFNLHILTCPLTYDEFSSQTYGQHDLGYMEHV